MHLAHSEVDERNRIDRFHVVVLRLRIWRKDWAGDENVAEGRVWRRTPTHFCPGQQTGPRRTRRLGADGTVAVFNYVVPVHLRLFRRLLAEANRGAINRTL